jgi:hypothetical protein
VPPPRENHVFVLSIKAQIIKQLFFLNVGPIGNTAKLRLNDQVQFFPPATIVSALQNSNVILMPDKLSALKPER